MHFEDQPINAQELLQRVGEMEAIAAMVGTTGSPERFRINVPIKPTNWACKWGMCLPYLFSSASFNHLFFFFLSVTFNPFIALSFYFVALLSFYPYLY